LAAETSRVRVRHQTIVYGFFVRQVPPLSDFDRVELADEIGDGNSGRGQFFSVSMISINPLNRQGITQLGQYVATNPTDRFVRIIVDLAARNAGDTLVQQAH